MLKEISLQNFKCFEKETLIPFSNFNLLTGINGRGKSTSLQALLLMRQSIEHNRAIDRLIFNGSCVDLGNFNDVRNSNISQRNAVEIKFCFDGVQLHYHLYENEADEMSMQIHKVIISEVSDDPRIYIETGLQAGEHVLQPHNNPLLWQDHIPRNIHTGTNSQSTSLTPLDNQINFARIHYVSADRIGPRDFYPKQSFADFPNVGRRGEYAPYLLYQMRDNRVHEDICHDKGATPTLLDQTQAWLSQIFDGARISLIPTEANLVLLTLRADELPTKGYKPANVGFGYSYALPIIVSGLIARPGEMLIVENPEAHVHPFAQSQIIQFLTRLSGTGVQVFVETHSDHILNAVRLSVLDKFLTSQMTNVLFFAGHETPSVTQIPVGNDGSIENWPNDFFDQLDKDFSRLFG